LLLLESVSVIVLRDAALIVLLVEGMVHPSLFFFCTIFVFIELVLAPVVALLARVFEFSSRFSFGWGSIVSIFGALYSPGVGGSIEPSG
jgi:hypothetical protein